MECRNEGEGRALDKLDIIINYLEELKIDVKGIRKDLDALNNNQIAFISSCNENFQILSQMIEINPELHHKVNCPTISIGKLKRTL
jgi:hypothetical protein